MRSATATASPSSATTSMTTAARSSTSAGAPPRLARLGRELRTRPLLREALRSGRVRLRAAETVLSAARGEAEAHWVERAATLTVRQLEAELRQAGTDPGDNEEEWLAFRAAIAPGDREVLDEALDVAGLLLPGSPRLERLEAMSQEFLGHFDQHPEADQPSDDARKLGPWFHPVGSGEATRQAALEADTQRWASLPDVSDWPAPEVRWFESATAQAVDAQLRALARERAGWDDLIGHCACALMKSRMYRYLGFDTFRHYARERLGLSGKGVEELAALERRIWASPALQEARRQKVPREKLRLLARLPESEIGSWVARAKALTCIALRRRVDGEKERKMRAQRRVGAVLPLRVAALLAASIQLVERRAGGLVPVSRCLRIVAQHFLDTWKHAVKHLSVSRKVRLRDGDLCQVPGCSHRAAHSHHVEPRGRGGGNERENQVATCGFHHLRCLHGGFLWVLGTAPADLTWLRGGEAWTGGAEPCVP